MSEYEALFPGKITKNTAPARQNAYPDEVESQSAQEVLKVAEPAQTPAKKERKRLFGKKKESESIAATTSVEVEKPKPALSAEEEKLVTLLDSGERLVDDVIAGAGLNVAQAKAMLTMLEIKGVIASLPGGRLTLK
jgi:predicted Rossmann fold nucleotide-binding protein DprA/Smf involved in DNA uptake